MKGAAWRVRSGPEHGGPVARAIALALLLALVGTGELAPAAASQPPEGTEGHEGTRGADGRNLFEWTGVAPIVVAGTSLGEDGHHFDFQVTASLRGDFAVGDELRIDVREANRLRDRMLHPKALRLDEGIDYVLLLEVAAPGGKHRLVRGVYGARELPLEGREAYLEALRAFIEIQDVPSEELKWKRLTELLGATNPLVIGTTLEEFLKFRRGEADLLLTLLPLLDHPQPPLRGDAARLIGQIVDRQREHGTTIDDDIVRAELIARATRDESVPVRVAATEALAAFPPELVDSVLVDIAESDPEQQVRYAAQLVRLERKISGTRENPPASADPPPVD